MNKLLLTITLCLGTSTAVLAQTNVGETGTVTFNYRGNNVTYTTVKAKDGRIWVQQNIGATRVATTNTDANAYGDYFQWGRWDDGHQIKGSTTTSLTMPSPNNPSGLNKVTGNSNPFYYQTNSPYVANDNFWGGGTITDTWDASTSENATATNGCDPCKQLISQGYRLPTKAEWEKVIADENITDRSTAYNSNLKIALAGYVGYNFGYNSSGSAARLWTSTADANGNAYLARFQSAAPTSTVVSNARASGLSIRCIFDINILPVSFIDFGGIYKNEAINLAWSTSTEQDNAHFNIYKSTNGQPFKLLTAIVGKGNTNNISKYTYTDWQPINGNNYYRLDQVDINGTTTVLKYVSIKVSLKKIDVSVRASNNNLEITYTGDVVRVDIHNISGNKLLSRDLNTTNTESGKININNSLPSGIYILTCKFKNGQTKSIKFSK